jgi:hypothetical protein
VTNVTISKVLRSVDMRGIHKLRHRNGGAAYWLALNRKLTIARIVGPEGPFGQGVWTFYAPDGEVFDTAKLTTLLRTNSLRVQVPEIGERPAMRRAA